MTGSPGRIRQYFGNVTTLVGQSMIQRAFGMLTTAILARNLGAVQFGIYSAIVNTGSGAYGLVRLGVDASIHVHAAESPPGRDPQTGRMLGAGLLLLTFSGMVGAIVCLLLDDWLASTVYGEPQLARWLSLAAILVLLQCLSQFCFVALAGLHLFSSYARVMICSAVATAAAVAVGTFAWGLAGAAAGYVLVQACTAVALGLAARAALREAGVRMTFAGVRVWMKRHVVFGFPFYVAGLVAVPATYYVQGMLARYAGLHALGELRVIVSLLALISFVPTAAAAAMVSLLARTSATSSESFAHDARLNLKYMWMFAVLAALCLSVALPVVVPVLFGDEYRGVIAPSSIAIVTTAFSCVLGVATNMLFARKRVALILVQALLQAALFVALAAVLVPSLGLTGYFLAELAGCVGAIAFLYARGRAWRRTHLSEERWFVPVLLLSALVSAVMVPLGAAGLSAYRTEAATVLTILTAALCYAFVLNDGERAALKLLVSRMSLSTLGKFR